MQLFIGTWLPQQNQIQEREHLKGILNSFLTNFNSRSSRLHDRSKRISSLFKVSYTVLIRADSAKIITLTNRTFSKSLIVADYGQFL